MNLSDEQMKVCEQIVHNYSKVVWRCSGIRRVSPIISRHSVTKIAGHAGTGKTYLIGELAKELRSECCRNLSIAFCAYTGKAAAVLKSRLNDVDAISGYDTIGTIHSLMYYPKYTINKDGKKIISGWKLKSEIDCDVIIIDEASMVNKKIFNDLMRYHKPIIAVGDHGQLPPIGDEFSLLENPDYLLKTIHRQAKDNPIINLSRSVRHNGFIKPGIYSSANGSKVFKLSWNDPRTKKLFHDIQWDNNYVILCAFNQTRVDLNNKIRKRLKNTLPEPYPNERIICLKNNHETKVMNGQLGTLVWFKYAAPKVYDMTIKLDGYQEFYNNLVHDCCFGQVSYDDAYDTITQKKTKSLIKRTGFTSVDLFDFGYAISVHRSQGSEWDNVVLFEQRTKHWDNTFYRKWLYTAITRAKKNLFVIYDYWGG